MRYALINPKWKFSRSVFLGCDEAHLPLELGYSKTLVEQAGHHALLIDAKMEWLDIRAVRERLRYFRPDFIVIPTAPSYMYWRSAPPELGTPMEMAHAVRDLAECLIAVGPHATSTPFATLRKMNADVAVLGDCEEVLPGLSTNWKEITSIAYVGRGGVKVRGAAHLTDMRLLPVLEWPAKLLAGHRHHHHRFDAEPAGPGAEMETTRGLPFPSIAGEEVYYSDYQKRPPGVVLEELDGLIAAGAQYVYFTDEVFLPNADLLEAVAHRGVPFGIQTRIDLWSRSMLDLLGRAGCVSVKTEVETCPSTQSGNGAASRCPWTPADLTEHLVYAKQRVRFVQANLLRCDPDRREEVELVRRELMRSGVWAAVPAPAFPYPGSAEYATRWGMPDDYAWERAHRHYLHHHSESLEVLEKRPVPLEKLEEFEPARHPASALLAVS